MEQLITNFTVSARFHESVQLFIFILLAIIFVLLLMLWVIHINIGIRSRKKKRLVINIGKAIKSASSQRAKDESLKNFIKNNKNIFTRRGLATLSEVLTYMNTKDRKKLRDLLIKTDCAEHLAKQLKTDNEDYMAEIVRLAVELNLVDLIDEIKHVMVAHKDNINVQYEAFLALSKLGSYDSIVNICATDDFSITLTFRSLLEIISAYSGDKTVLYKALLKSSDAYVVRICVKLIGSEKRKNLAPDIEEFLDSDKISLKMDTMRALSALRYRKSLDKFAMMMKSDSWEVRSIAVKALATIDAETYVDELILALQDPEWQVRYNAGSALSKLKDREDEIYDKIVESGDKFAKEMYESFKQMANIGRANA